MSTTRNALMAFVVIVTLATVACQPTDPIVEAGARATHPVIDVPPGPTLLPNAAAPSASSATPR
jgi:hypothetical protein